MNIPLCIRRFVFSIGLILVFGGLVHPVDSPLEPVDTSSPRATYRSFIRQVSIVEDALERNLPKEVYRDAIPRILDCFDLSQVPLAERIESGNVAALLLVEILGRLDPVDVSSLPDAADVEEEGITRWPIPDTEIYFERITEGDRVGEFLFSARTVERMEEFYQKIKSLPYRPGAWEKAYTTYLNIPGTRVPVKWADDFPDWLTISIFNLPAWKFAFLFLSIVLLFTLILFSFRLANRFGGPPGETPNRRRFANLFLCLFLIFLFRIFRVLVTDVIGVRRNLQNVLYDTAFIAARIFLIAAVFVVFDLLYTAAISSRYLKGRGINDHLFRVITQLLGLIVSAYIAIKAVEYLGLQIIPLLAGLGIGGIAIALAARPTLENVIGGLILFADKPVKVGDLCGFGDELGFVEEIGLRSTRIRKIDDTLVSIPNAQFSQMSLENRTRRHKFLYESTLQFRYESTDDQLRYLLVQIREMLFAHPRVYHDHLRLRFLGFGDYSLDIYLFAYLRAKDRDQFLAVREDVNFRIMKIVKECGASFAFPSTTAYIAQDGEADEKAVRDSEKRVEKWRKDGVLPFPDHTAEDRRELKNTLDYPPPGSPGKKE